MGWSELGDSGTPLQYSCLENPMGGQAWQAAVHGVTKSRTRLSHFTLTFHSPWWAAIYGVAQSQTRLKRLSSSSSRDLGLRLFTRRASLPPNNHLHHNGGNSERSYLITCHQWMLLALVGVKSLDSIDIHTLFTSPSCVFFKLMGISSKYFWQTNCHF